MRDKNWYQKKLRREAKERKLREVVSRPRVDVNWRTHQIADRCEQVLHQRGVRFYKSGGTIGITSSRVDSVGIRPVTVDRLSLLLGNVVEFGSYQCADEKGQAACWQTHYPPYSAIALMLDRIRGRLQLGISWINNPAHGQRKLVH